MLVNTILMEETLVSESYQQTPPHKIAPSKHRHERESNSQLSSDMIWYYI